MTDCRALTLLHADPDRFGQRLHAAVWSQAGAALLADGMGWNEGGCLLLADALAQLLGTHDLVALVRAGNDLGQHYLAQVGGWYLDADGVSDAQALLWRWEREEYMHHPIIKPIGLVRISPETPRDPMLSAAIAAFLTEALTKSPTMLGHLRYGQLDDRTDRRR